MSRTGHTRAWLVGQACDGPVAGLRLAFLEHFFELLAKLLVVAGELGGFLPQLEGLLLLASVPPGPGAVLPKRNQYVGLVRAHAAPALLGHPTHRRARCKGNIVGYTRSN